MIDRRRLLAGAAGLVASPALAQAARDPEADLNALFDTFGRSPVEEASRLEGFNAAGLGPSGRLAREVVLHGLKTDAEFARRFPYGAGPAAPYAVTYRSGAHQRVQPGAAPGDAAALTLAVTAETAAFARAAAAGWLPPRFLVEAALAPIRRAAGEAERRGEGSLAAAFHAQTAALEAAMPAALEHPGVGRLPNGDAYYALCLRRAYGAAISPMEVRRRAETEIARLTRRADRLLTGQGLRRGAVAQRLQVLSADPRHLYPDSDAGRGAAVADMNAALGRLRPRLGEAFRDLPPLAGAVLRMSPADEAARRPGERTPEGYLVDLADIRARPTWTLPSVAYHELIPGHLLQSQIERRRAPHRMQVRYAPGYSEGWAVYAERLAGDLGLYADDPRGELGMIHWLLFRMARVLADVGVHAFGWTMDEAVRRVRAIQGPAIAFVGIEEDVRRLCLIPGAYAGQGLTYLELAQLRRARAPRRAAWPGFHAAVLSHGPLPPSALRRS